jgi:hypothetical protein
MTDSGKGWKTWRRSIGIASACATAAVLIVAVEGIFGGETVAAAGGQEIRESLKVLEPIVRGNLTLFPVVADRTRDSSMLMTLDEGIRSGEVTVTEAGDDRGLVRREHGVPPRRSGAEVNRLVLVNYSKKPLLLLAGEIVTGGKQDRVIGADRIVPPDSPAVDLGVFCVEPGRWVESSANFASLGAQMAQPSVRTPAMAEHNQAKVWENVRTSNANISAGLAAPAAAQVESTTSYAKVFSNAEVAKVVSSEYGGAEGERAMLRELKEKGAVGVVVAIDGKIEWADVFASNDLLARYWPKLVRSYVAEAMTNRNSHGRAEVRDAQMFIDTLSGGREVVETEPGIFRRSDVTGDGYRVFTLTALVPRTGYVVHLTKMRQADALASK